MGQRERISGRIGVSLLVGIVVLMGAQACVFGGGSKGNGNSTTPRQGAVPTATLPATMTDPIVLSASESSNGTEPNSSGITATTTYTVQSGDSLGAIAAAQGVPAAQQAAWIAQVEQLNNLPDPRLLHAGDELILPVVENAPTPEATSTPSAASAATPQQAAPTSTPAAAAATATPEPAATVASNGQTYTVQSGDNPYVIAAALGVPEAKQAAWVAELVALNNINPNSLSVGQVLELPADTP